MAIPERERAFLEQILAQPDDDSPRMIFADWLEETGQSDRAEFIRVQIERHSLPKWDRRQLPLLAREAALLRDHEVEWKESLPKIPSVTWGKFRRGLIATATFSDVSQLGSRFQDCHETAPLEAISIDWPNTNYSFDNPAPLPGLKELTLEDAPYLEGEEIDMVAWSPILTGIESLRVGRCNLGDDGIRRLIDSTSLGSLKSLQVPHNGLGNNGLEAIMGAPSLNSLEELDVSEQESYSRYEEDPVIDENGMLSMIDWPGMNRIRALHFSGNRITTSALHALLQSDSAANLKHLVLRDNGLEAASMEAFESANQKIELETLDLGENYLSDVGADFLAKARCLAQLKSLRMDRCEFGRGGGIRLADAQFFYSIRRLNIDDNRLGPDGLRAILQRVPDQLHTLQISNNDLNDEAARDLASSVASERLQAIDLSENQLSNDAIDALVESSHLGNMLMIRLNDNPIAATTAAKLLSSELGKRLLMIEDHILEDEGIPFA